MDRPLRADRSPSRPPDLGRHLVHRGDRGGPGRRGHPGRHGSPGRWRPGSGLQLPALQLPGLLLSALLLTGCVVGLPGSQRGTGSAPADGPATIPADRRGTACAATQGQLVVERVNEIRREHGLGGVAVESRLVEAARSHAQDQASRGAAGVGHAGSDGSAPADRVTAAGYRWGMVAENVGAGYASADAVVSAWMNSPPHRATILSPEALHAGVGYVYGSVGSMRHYWTLKVAEPLQAPQAVDGEQREPLTAQLLACHP